MKRVVVWAVLAIIGIGSDAAATDSLVLGVIFPGSIQDRDYNAIGHAAAETVKADLGIGTRYRQRVALADLETAVGGLESDGAKMIWTHGGQYSDRVLELCGDHPETVFVIEGDEPPSATPPNVMVLGGRSYHKSYYVLGALAARLTQTGRIGYIGGLELPFTYGEINAAWQAISAHDDQARLHHLYAGDFNDPLKTRLVAEALIDRGCDVLLSGVNLGNFGLFEAVRKAPRKVYFTTTYTRKSGYVPGHYLCSDIVDYVQPLTATITAYLNGRRSGYYPVTWGEGRARYISFPIQNVPEILNDEIRRIASEVDAGQRKVLKITDRLTLPE